MVSKICEIFEMIQEAEEIDSFIFKWKKFLDVTDKEQQLKHLIVFNNQHKVEADIEEIESNFSVWQEKIRKKLKFNSWRKSQRERSKVTRKLFRICKAEWKQKIDSEYENLLKSQATLNTKPSKSQTKHIKLLLSILKHYDPEKFYHFESELAKLKEPSPLPTSPSSPPNYTELHHIQDYLSLLSSNSFYQSRLDSWLPYN